MSCYAILTVNRTSATRFVNCNAILTVNRANVIVNLTAAILFD